MRLVTMVIRTVTMVIRTVTMVIRTVTTIVFRHLGVGLGVGLGAGKTIMNHAGYQRVKCQVWDVWVSSFIYARQRFICRVRLSMAFRAEGHRLGSAMISRLPVQPVIQEVVIDKVLPILAGDDVFFL